MELLLELLSFFLHFSLSPLSRVDCLLHWHLLLDTWRIKTSIENFAAIFGSRRGLHHGVSRRGLLVWLQRCLYRPIEVWIIFVLRGNLLSLLVMMFLVLSGASLDDPVGSPDALEMVAGRVLCLIPVVLLVHGCLRLLPGGHLVLLGDEFLHLAELFLSLGHGTEAVVGVVDDDQGGPVHKA